MALNFLNNGYFAAKVGIGTDSPSSLLSLGNAVDAQKLLLYDDNNNFKYGFGIQSNELRQFFPNSATSRMVFGTISDSDGSTFSEKMRIDSAGNVGIGESDPKAPGGAGATTLTLKGTNFPQFISVASNATANSTTWRSIARNNLVYQIQTVNDAITSEQTAYEISRAGGSNSISYQRWYSGTTEAMRITSAGNIGISGDTSAWSLGKTIQINSNYGAINYNGVSAILGIVNAYYNGSGYIRQNVGYAASIDFNTAISGGGLAFRTENSTGAAGDTISLTTKVAILSNGRVGIGTTTVGTLHGVSYGPTMLHVDGGASRGQMILEGDQLAGVIMSDNGATANERVFTTMVDGGNYQIKPVNDNGTSTAAGAAITVLHNSNVGIGTITPGTKLDVQGTILVNNEIQFVDSNMRIFRSSNDMRFRTGGSDKVTIESGGNVGIGITGPNAKLHVVSSGVAAFFDSVNQVPVSILSTNSADRSTIGFQSLTSVNDYNVRVGAEVNDFITYTNNTEKMRISSAGAIKFNSYGAGTLVTDAFGNITAATSGPGSGDITGIGTAGYVTKFTGNKTIGNGPIYFNNNDIELIQPGVFNNSLAMLYNGTASGGTGTTAVQYIKIFDKVGNGGQQYLHFELLSINNSEYSAEVKITVPSYSGFSSSYGTMDTGQGVQIEIIYGGLTGQTSSIVSIIECADLASTSTNTDLYLKIQPAATNTQVKVRDYGDCTERVLTNQTWSTTAPSNQTREFTFNSGATNINQVLSIHRDQKVGIGTTSPDCKLDVRKSGTTAAQGDTDLFIGDSGAASSTAQVQILGGASGFSNLYFSDTGAYNIGGFIYNHTNNYLATNVNGLERMRIKSDGNVIINNSVSIGTSVAPTRTLDVRGNGLSIYGSGGNTELMLRGQVEGTGTVRNLGAWHWSVRADVGGDNDDLKLLRFITGTFNGTAMQISNSNGSIAIGTNITPSVNYKLDIITSVDQQIPLRIKNSDADSSTFMRFEDNGGQYWDTGINYANNDYYLKYGGANKARFTNAGGLDVYGIGNSILTLNPGTTAGNYSALNVGRTDGAGTAHVTPAVTGGVPIGGIAGIVFGSASTSLPAVAIQTPNSTNGHIVFKPAGAEMVRIQSDGKVGIGTTGPSQKLQVNQTNNDLYQLTLHNTHLSTTAKTRIGNWVDQVKISSNYMQFGGTKTQDNTAKASWVQTMGDDLFDISRSPAASTTLSSLMNINSSGSTTFAGTITSGVLTVGNSGTSRFTATNSLPLQLSRGLNVSSVGAAGVVIGFGSLVGTTYTDAVHLGAVLQGNGTDGDFILEVLNNGTLENALRIDSTKSIKFSGYDSTNQTGTPTYMLGTDGSGNVVKVLGADIPGSGGANNWTLSGSNIYNNNSGNVGIKNTSPGEALTIGNYDTVANGTMRITAPGGQSIGVIRNSLEFALQGPTSVNNGDAYKFSIGLNSAVGTSGNYNSDFAIRRTTRLGVTDNVDFLIDGTTGNIGIGTPTPNSLLQLYKASGNAQLEIEAVSAGDPVIKFVSANDREGNIFYTDGTTVAKFSYDHSAVAFKMYAHNQTSVDFYLGENTAYFPQQNVGIGTTSPDTTLEVQNPTLATDTVNTLLTQRWSRLQTGAVKWGNSMDLLLGSYESGTINSRTRVDFKLANGATDDPDTTVMTLQANGNVGIGTNAPATLLHVKGGADDNEALLYVENTHSAGGTQYPSAMFTNTNGNHSFGTVAEFRTGNVAGTDRPSILFTNGVTTNNWSVGQGVYAPNDNFAIGFRTGHPGVVSAWADPKLVILTSGNVGIGTTGPVAKLQIVNTSASTAALTVCNFINGASDYVFQRWQYVESSTNFRLDLKQKTLSGVVKYAFDMVNNGTGYNDVLVLDRGNVGIGTNSPDALLSLGPTGGQKFYVYSDGSTVKAGMGVDLSGSSRELSIFHSSSNSVDGDISFGYRLESNGTYQERMRIQGNGNVGIGDTSPDYRLSVAKVNAATPAIMVSGAFYGGPRIQTYGLDADSNAWMGLGTDMTGGAYEHNIYFSDHGGYGRLSMGTYNGTTYSEKMCILRTGNVGIGMDSPSKHFTVRSLNNSASTFAGFYALNLSQGVEIGYGGIYMGGNNAAVDMNLQAKGTGDILMTGSGKVGIGLTIPAYKLEVAGNVGIGFATGNKIVLTSQSGFQNSTLESHIISANGLGSFGSGDLLIQPRCSTSSTNNIVFGTSGGTNTTAERMRITSTGVRTVYGSKGSPSYSFINDATTGMFSPQASVLNFTGGGNERLSIDSLGQVGINQPSPTATLHLKALASNGVPFKLEAHPSTTVSQMLIFATKAYNSSDAWYNLVCEAGNGSGGQTNTLIIERDGDVLNKNNTYGQISDSRLKENIIDATPKLDDIMKVKVKNFNFIGEDLKQIGVVAQELEEVFPGLVKEDKQPDLNGEEGGVYKSVKYSVLVPILVKAMQEQQEIIENLTTRIEQLEN